MAVVVGRERELASVEALLEEGRERYVGLAVEGEPGIGKTTVWREAVRLAENTEFRVLSCRPVEAEAKLAFASVADLLEPVGEHALAELPEPQRHALEVALLHASPRGARADPRAVATAVRAVLERLASQSPLLVAIDDAQWLDPSSAAALGFAMRRLPEHARVALLVALRVEPEPSFDPLELLPPHARRIRVGPLSLSALYHVLRSQLGVVFPRPVLQRIEQTAAGNPFFALELARALEDAGGRPGPGEPLPVPDSLGGLLRRRIQKLPRPVRDTLLVCALASSPTTQLLERVLGAKGEPTLERALQEDVVELRGDEIRFRHPLLASAVASSAVPGRRRDTHRRLATAVASEEEQARHLALGTDAPSEEVADRLEQAARRADERGGSEEAVELLELARRFTPADDPDALARRTVELARVVGRVGDGSEAIRLLDEVLRTEARGPVRAQALELRAQTHWVAGTTDEAMACCDEALLHVGDDQRLRARVLVTLARVTLDAELLHERAENAVDSLEAVDDPDPALLSEALVALAGAEYYLGRGIPWEAVERGLELERIVPTRNVSDRMSAALGAWLKYDGDFEGARKWLEATRRAALDEGDEGSLPYALSHLPQLELWTGNWSAAERRALEHLELAERTGQANERLTAIYNLTLVHTHQGRTEEALARLEPALEEAEGRGEPWNVYQLLSVLGFLRLSLEEVDEAVSALGRALEIYQSTGAGDTPSVFENHPEALVLAGDLETAMQVVDLFERRARTANKAFAVAPALRCRALIAEARRDLDAATAALEEALEHHERVEAPFSKARTLLVLGRVRRRVGERRAAKAALGDAREIFAGLGAPLWAERAWRELSRVPIRRSASSDDLTPTEERVAGLVAEGRTNKEVAQALFVSEKTVEANLTRIYRKLGVRSRAGLAARLHRHERGEEPAIP